MKLYILRQSDHMKQLRLYQKSVFIYLVIKTEVLIILDSAITVIFTLQVLSYKLWNSLENAVQTNQLSQSNRWKCSLVVNEKVKTKKIYSINKIKYLTNKNIYSVKPVYNNHPWDLEKVAF